MFLLLCSCDPTVFWKSLVTWNIENKSETTLVVKTIGGKTGTLIDIDTIFAGEFELLEKMSFNESGNALFQELYKSYNSITVETKEGDVLFDNTVLRDSSLWRLSLQQEVVESFSEYDTWYDYTFTITDEMLEAARKGGGE
ncbi:MAG: hypothetical protein J6Q59_08950 [Paludibacteraceae bacterium]|nr:hypothetical protein [Paludibacteraceae bacterium]MBO5864379.1 hypothetical protein [Paludibacteraceae bacterium]